LNTVTIKNNQNQKIKNLWRFKMKQSNPWEDAAVVVIIVFVGFIVFIGILCSWLQVLTGSDLEPATKREKNTRQGAGTVPCLF
jgi:hypothetical protein